MTDALIAQAVCAFILLAALGLYMLDFYIQVRKAERATARTKPDTISGTITIRDTERKTSNSAIARGARVRGHVARKIAGKRTIAPKPAKNKFDARAAVVAEWKRIHGFADSAPENFARAKDLDQAILMLRVCEQAIIILRHGLIGGRPLTPDSTRLKLASTWHGLRTFEHLALRKIDALHGRPCTIPMYDLRWDYYNDRWTDPRVKLSTTGQDATGAALPRSSQQAINARARGWINDQIARLRDEGGGNARWGRPERPKPGPDTGSHDYR